MITYLLEQAFLLSTWTKRCRLEVVWCNAWFLMRIHRVPLWTTNIFRLRLCSERTDLIKFNNIPWQVGDIDKLTRHRLWENFAAVDFINKHIEQKLIQLNAIREHFSAQSDVLLSVNWKPHKEINPNPFKASIQDRVLNVLFLLFQRPPTQAQLHRAFQKIKLLIVEWFHSQMDFLWQIVSTFELNQ